MGECFAFKKQIQKEIDEGRLIFTDQEKKDTNPSLPKVNMVETKGKKPASKSESPARGTSANSIP